MRCSSDERVDLLEHRVEVRDELADLVAAVASMRSVGRLDLDGEVAAGHGPNPALSAVRSCSRGLRKRASSRARRRIDPAGHEEAIPAPTASAKSSGMIVNVRAELYVVGDLAGKQFASLSLTRDAARRRRPRRRAAPAAGEVGLLARRGRPPRGGRAPPRMPSGRRPIACGSGTAGLLGVDEQRGLVSFTAASIAPRPVGELRGTRRRGGSEMCAGSGCRCRRSARAPADRLAARHDRRTSTRPGIHGAQVPDRHHADHDEERQQDAGHPYSLPRIFSFIGTTTPEWLSCAATTPRRQRYSVVASVT